jgi:tetratricopeptide (TPR) repeat protein
MAKKKRISRKELLKGPDEFMTFSAKTIQLVQKNQKQVSYTLIGVIVVVLGLFAFRYFSSVSERKAYALFEEGLAHYVSQASQGQSTQLDETAKEKFAEINEKFPSTRAARLSLPLLADMYYKTGSYDKAIELYRQALKGFEGEASVLASIWNGMGYAYEGKKDYQSAVDSFQKIIAFEGAFMKADAYFNLGRMYELLNNKEKALEAYEMVADQYADSVHGSLAKEKVRRLKN